EVVIAVGSRPATGEERAARQRAGEPPVDAMVTLALRDTGCGMPDEHLARAFEPFFTTKAIGDGTGLGLFLSRQIVAVHGGALSIESAVGKGTTVMIVLPAYPEETARNGGADGGV
ncbi:MAG: HAMP domain-containing histidine kinase, partial [Nitrospira sp.]|nr:HAMP domain-containing histidine kinase [Nitrospira sp.]